MIQQHFILAEFFQAYDELTPSDIHYSFDLLDMKITSLGNLKYVGGYLNCYNSTITSLGNLEFVDSHLNLIGTNVTSLDNLIQVNRNLYIQGAKISSLNNLKYVGKIYVSDRIHFDKLQSTNKNNLNIIDLSTTETYI